MGCAKHRPFKKSDLSASALRLWTAHGRNKTAGARENIFSSTRSSNLDEAKDCNDSQRLFRAGW